MKKDFLECGKIVATHGIKGEVRINPWCDEPEDLLQLKYIYFNEGKEKIKIDKIRTKGNQIVVKLEGFENPDAAQALRGKTIYLNRNDMKLSEGEYFIADIIGLKVIDADTQEEYGVLTDVSPTGANDVYHITFKDGTEKLIPAIKQVLIETDIDSGILKIRPLKGLFDHED